MITKLSKRILTLKSNVSDDCCSIVKGYKKLMTGNSRLGRMMMSTGEHDVSSYLRAHSISASKVAKSSTRLRASVVLHCAGIPDLSSFCEHYVSSTKEM